MDHKREHGSVLALDVGEKRIGVATAANGIKIAVPKTTLLVDGTEINQIKQLIQQEQIETLVVGYPRNQSGDATAQTEYVETFARQLEGVTDRMVYQDESLTSVTAEQRLKQTGKPYQKGDIDAMAASIILQDYLELHG